MKTLKTFLLLFIACTFCTIQQTLAQAPTSGLVAYYPFNGNPNDASGSSRNGTISGGVNPTTDRFGVANQAYAFNGSNGYINVANWSILNGNAARTMMVWFKTSVPANPQYFLAWGNWGVSNYSAIGTYFNGSTRNLGFTGWANDLAVQDQLQYYDNQWHLIAVTFDGSTLNLYLDGVSIQSKTTTLNTTLTSWMRIGLNYDRDYFNGSLDEARIYNRALTASEIQQTYVAEAPTTSTAEVLRLGADRFIHTTGIANTFMGRFAGNSITSGVGSTFMGSGAGLDNTSGTNNTFIGNSSGRYNISGSYNTYLGYDAGWRSNGNYNVTIGRSAGGWATTGSNNSYIGYNAGTGTETQPNTGTSNTFLGFVSGKINSTGSFNTFLGSNTGENNSTGTDNTFIGGVAGGYNVQGSSNTFIGYASGWRNTASDNVAVGRSAGAFNTIGTKNTFVGTLAGLGIEATPSTGSQNTFMGYQSGFKNTTASNNVFIGWASGYENTAGSDNTALGTQAGGLNSTGAFNTNIGKLAGYDNVGGSNNTFVGAGANSYGPNKVSLFSSSAIGSNARVSINNAIVLGDFQNNDLKVGIGVHDPQHRLDVKGVINMRAALNSPSLKINGKDFLGIDEGGEFVVSNFKMKYQSENQWADRVFKKGYILMPLAQLDEYIKTHEHLPGIPTASEAVEKGVSTQEMTAKLLEKVEELTRYVIELKNENESLKKDYQEVLKRLPTGNK